MTDAPSVAVLGGGIGGLTAAQELAERGFDVTVYEANDRVGGKARSVPVDDGDRPLMGEHGFRFFPAYYRNVVDTMARIPDADARRGDGAGTVEDHLVGTSETLLAGSDGTSITASTERPESPREWLEAFRPQVAVKDVPNREIAHFLSRLGVLLTSCERRREQEFEHQSWWEFIDADEMSPAYRKHLARSTQSLVALRPQDGSARTVGNIYLQLLFGQLDSERPAERVLDGPTSDVWLEPWAAHLRDLGVEIHTETPVEAIESNGERITGVVADGERVTADFYVAAVPVEVMVDLLTPALERAAPSLSGTRRVDTAWMNGVQFYLDRDVELAAGHAVFLDSPWALTAISQQQFWRDHDLGDRSDGEVEGVLSVIASDWETPGILSGKPGRECTREEAVEEIWAQVQSHLGDETLPEGARVTHFLDPELTLEDDGLDNGSPLVINTVGSLQHRPEAGTEAENLALAADYVRVDTDLATMEAANEAGRHAANAVLSRSSVRARPVETWGLVEPSVFDPPKKEDAFRYRLGLPHPGEAGRDAWKFARKLRP